MIKYYFYFIYGKETRYVIRDVKVLNVGDRREFNFFLADVIEKKSMQPVEFIVYRGRRETAELFGGGEGGNDFRGDVIEITRRIELAKVPMIEVLQNLEVAFFCRRRLAVDAFFRFSEKSVDCSSSIDKSGFGFFEFLLDVCFGPFSKFFIFADGFTDAFALIRIL